MQSPGDNKHGGLMFYVWPSSTKQPPCEQDIFGCKVHEKISGFSLQQAEGLAYPIGKRVLKPPRHKFRNEKEGAGFQLPAQER